MNIMPTSLNFPEVSLNSLLWNLLICTIISAIMSWHFNYRSKKRFLRRDLGLILPVICLTTLLVISVVKSSLALSLGLVGALSIVRFRTPIKEPEELAYIFLAIAIGLSLGADQRQVACIVLPIILVVISLIDLWKPSLSKGDGNIILNVEIDKEIASAESVLNLIRSISSEANIRRFDQDGNNFSIVALIKISDSKEIIDFSELFHSKFPNCRFSLIDDSSFPNE